VLARWAAVLLSLGAVATATIPLLPQLNQRLFAIPPSVALIGLGWSLWQLRPATRPDSASVSDSSHDGLTPDGPPAERVTNGTPMHLAGLR
jgi:hypothetical protein